MNTDNRFHKKFTLVIITLLLVMLAFQSGQSKDTFGASIKDIPIIKPDDTGITKETSTGLTNGPLPTIPPDTSKITVGSPDIAGYAQVSGDAGAVPPDADVVIVNLSAHNLITTTADIQGSFLASLYAPPGSSLLIKYEQGGFRIPWFWQRAVSAIADATTENLNPLPGAVIYVGGPESAFGETQTFHSVGAQAAIEPPKRWAAWQMSGELTVPDHPGDWRLTVIPGETVNITLDMRATSPALECGEPFPELSINLGLREMFGVNGVAKPWEIWFDSFIFTPTGLPIEHEGYVPPVDIPGTHIFQDLTCMSPQVMGGSLEFSFTIPADLPEGYYRPEFYFNPQIPLSDEVPQAVVWMHEAERASGLPILRVGDAAPPRIPWILFGNELINGQRGASALQDQGSYAMVNRVTTPVKMAVIPRMDERSGVPITYHLEPGASWLSNTDRRLAPPPHIPLLLPSGELSIEIHKPDGSVDILGPAPLQQSSVRTPTTPGGAEFAIGTGHIGDLYNLYNHEDTFAYTFLQSGLHFISLHGSVYDVFGNPYSLESNYEVVVAHVLDLDPNILPTTPFSVGDFFSPGLHVFPPLPAEVRITFTHLPYSDPSHAQITEITGQANPYGYFHTSPDTTIQLETPGEFRVDIIAQYYAPDGEGWFGSMTWGGVVESLNPSLVAHGRRGMDYKSDTVDDMPIWFRNQDLPAGKIGIENYYPYFSGDIHWGDQTPDEIYKGDSIHTILTFEDLTGPEFFYNLARAYYPTSSNGFRWPPLDTSPTGLEKRIAIGETPLFIATQSGVHPELHPEDIKLWGYWYGSSQRPDVRVRELISVDNMGTAYWRFDDTYGYQISEPADGDKPGDIKWEFGGIVFREVSDTNPINEYAIYSSLWVLLPDECDAYGCARVTPPFQDATGASINGGPILTIGDEEIDMLFLPKCIRPGDILELEDNISFCGHVGPPLDSRVAITITAPSGAQYIGEWHASKIGWFYDPSFDFPASEAGRWTVEVLVEHDRPYVGNGVIPQSHNTGTVLGTSGTYEFYVVEADTPELGILTPRPGFITWPESGIEPITISGITPQGTTAVHFTIHDKGIVMGQGMLTPDATGRFTLVYDAETLHETFSMLSLTAHEGRWEGLSDEVSIHFLAVGGEQVQAASVTLISEQVFVKNSVTLFDQFLPVIAR